MVTRSSRTQTLQWSVLGKDQKLHRCSGLVIFAAANATNDFQLKCCYFQFPLKSVKKSQANKLECKNIAEMFSCKVQIYVFILQKIKASVFTVFTAFKAYFFPSYDFKMGNNSGDSPRSALCAQM